MAPWPYPAPVAPPPHPNPIGLGWILLTAGMFVASATVIGVTVRRRREQAQPKPIVVPPGPPPGPRPRPAPTPRPTPTPTPPPPADAAIHREHRLQLASLRYPVEINEAPPPTGTVRQFQIDANRVGEWMIEHDFEVPYARLVVDGDLGPATENVLRLYHMASYSWPPTSPDVVQAARTKVPPDDLFEAFLGHLEEP